ncbi:hypothetical protein PVAND_013468 [Polypedilum vanderplanki]|uniref:Uncharacterized protein n=1 Tax=Polypedilum vanderplanki TaxID=319348 RepID=A0A9J6CRH5_POLVA|nr:hypothetical protein PVAND_013468 [Polypedilum vanderplanki]
MKFKLIVALAIICLAAFLETQAYHHHHHHCKKKECDDLKYFDYSRCDCRCIKRDLCHRRQEWDNDSCSCKCPWYRNPDNCINWEEFDEKRCKCYCPFSRHHKCPSNKVWNYEKCHCDCINTKKNCKDGERFSRSRCKCVIDIFATSTLPPTNAPTDAPITKTTTIAPVTNAPTDAPSTDISTNAPVTNGTDAPATNIPTLAPITNVAAFLETQAYHHHHHCKKKECDDLKYFDYNRCNCRCIKRDKCHRRQEWDNDSCSCKCPWYRNPDNCINWEEFDEKRCKCYCPFSRHHKCPSNKVWNYEKCHCDCINSKKDCKDGERFSRSRCKCVIDIFATSTLPPTNAPTDAPITKTTTIAPVTNAPTDAPSTDISTNAPMTNGTSAPATNIPTLAPITNAPTDAPVTTTASLPDCSFSALLYKNEETIPGIAAGSNFDGSIAYAAYIQIDQTRYVGALNTPSSYAAGFYYSSDGAVNSATDNVMYLFSSNQCNCRFIPIENSLPPYASYALINDGFGVGSISFVNDALQLIAVGRVDLATKTLYYPDYVNFIEISANNSFNILVCNFEPDWTTTSVQDVTTPPPPLETTSSLPLDSQLLAIQADINDLLINETYIELTEKDLITNLITRVQALLSDTTLTPEVISYLQGLSLALKDLQTEALNINRRRKRQTDISIYTCVSLTEEVAGAQSDKTIYKTEITNTINVANRFEDFLNLGKTFKLVSIISDLENLVNNLRSQVDNKEKLIKKISIKKNIAAALLTILCANTTTAPPETTVAQTFADVSTDAPSNATTDPPFNLSMLSDEDFTTLVTSLQSLIDGYKASLPNLSEGDKIQIADIITTIEGLITNPNLSPNVVTSMNGIITSFKNILSQAQ